MLNEAAKQNFRDIKRFSLMISVIFRIGCPLFWRWISRQSLSAADVGKGMRRGFEVMGLTYVKLGQFLALRFDLFPEELCDELSLLLDDVAPMSEADTWSALASALGGALEDHFADFDIKPIAAASVAQVHRAKMQDGTEVAVKLQRLSIAERFAADMRILVLFSRLGDRLGLMGEQSISEAIIEFRRFTQRELDFRVEARTAERLRTEAGPNETAPLIHWGQTHERILTMELIKGNRLSDVMAGRGGALQDSDLDIAARNLARASFRQLFVNGFFHADPHPGNIFVLDNGDICFIDFGIFGDMPASRREAVTRYIENVAVGNLEAAYRSFLTLLEPGLSTDFAGLRRDALKIFADWHAALSDPNAATTERYLGRYVGEFMAAIRRNHVRMDVETLLFWRALVTLDSTAMKFRAHFDLLGTLREFFLEVRGNPITRGVSELAKPERAAVSLSLVLTGAAQCSVFAGGDGIGQNSVKVRTKRETAARDHHIWRWPGIGIVATLGIAGIAMAEPALFLATPFLIVGLALFAARSAKGIG